MLTAFSSIPTNVREGFDVQDLPLRATSVSAEQMKEVVSGAKCRPYQAQCWSSTVCCSGRCVWIIPWRHCGK
jgi:hypothetical protein